MNKYLAISTLLYALIRASLMMDESDGLYSWTWKGEAVSHGAYTVFIAGYQDLTDEEFASAYTEELDKYIKKGSAFILSDEPGTCVKAYDYLVSHHVSSTRISIYMNEVDETEPVHITTGANIPIYRVRGGESERYALMAERSDHSIIWLRDGDTLADHGCTYAPDGISVRFTGAKEARRLMGTKSMRHAMHVYDQIV